MKTSIAAGLIAAALLATASTAYAQGVPGIPRPPPNPDQTVNLLYFDSGNDELGSDDVLFNSCFASQHSSNDYAYVTFGPKNATINFYKDTDCKDFAFGLNGYYGGYPGQARSFRWVGWSENALGQLFTKPIAGQGEAALHPGGPAPVTPPVGIPPADESGHNNNPPPSKTPDQATGGSTSKSGAMSAFVGGLFGALIVGGLIFWRTSNKKRQDDKDKDLLPYSRGSTHGDDEILLTTHNRSHLNNDSSTFSIGDEDDSDDSDDERHVRRHNNDEDDDDEDDHEDIGQKPRPGRGDHFRDD
ncbi:hypothetical protein FBU30_000858 [Linnemannia zychae]|nr:hypothetical protein FBU30_000858 [Linnemannia zychae]